MICRSSRVLPFRHCVHMLGVAALLFVLTPLASAETFENPIGPHGADPWVIQWEGQYFYTRTVGGRIIVWRSPWLQDIDNNDELVWVPPPDTGYSHNVWAPELHRLDGKWYLCFAADDGHDINHRMYVLEGNSQDPQGSYSFKGQISIPEDRWAIDGTVFEHDGRTYFIWSGRTADRDQSPRQGLYIAEMTNPWTLTGERIRISEPEHEWEMHGHPVNEGPQILRNDDGGVLLTYSGSGFYSAHYAVGALTLRGDDPLDPDAWYKLPEPLFQQGNEVEGPGHASFVKSPDGSEHWIVYHARTEPQAPRDLRIQRFTFGPDGVPRFDPPTPTGQAVPVPAGEPLVTFIPNMSFDRGGEGEIDQFNLFGEAGVVANDGERFSIIADGDGPNVGYLGMGVDSGLHQDLGPLHEGAYTFSVSLAVSDDERAAVEAHPGVIVLQLESIGLDENGEPDDDDTVILAQSSIDSDDLNDSAFTDFDVSAVVQNADRIGSWLRVAVYAPAESADASARWSVKLDHLRLHHEPLESASRSSAGH